MASLSGSGRARVWLRLGLTGRRRPLIGEASSSRGASTMMAREATAAGMAGRGRWLMQRSHPLRERSRHVHLQIRSISIARIATQSLRYFRLPIGLASLVAGAMTYISYQLDQLGQGLGSVWKNLTSQLAEASDTAQEWLGEAKTRASDYAARASDWAGGRGHDLSQAGSSLQIGLNEWWSAVKQQVGKTYAGDGSGSGQGDGKSSSSSSAEGGPQSDGPSITAAAALTATAIARSSSAQDNGTNGGESPPLMLLTRKLIEIRNILLELDESLDPSETATSSGRSLRLPSIVVIGSQSSGKSSVLEAIVGHEFLPKGDNMVTRRPIELTLVHESAPNLAEYGIFPQLGGVKLESFADIQRTLLEQNLQVSEAECVSVEPIRLSIHSPNVPDLTLIDLPGYIQISSLDQPEELKSKIEDLCHKYIQEPNLILSVCSADVDLANSPALRASRKVDPLGLRTMGVITKMDLVDPARGVAILSNRKYPLHLGYVGVVSKMTEGMKASGANVTELVVHQEDQYFKSHPEFANSFSEDLDYPSSSRSTTPRLDVGVARLRKKLMLVLEENMSRSLSRIADNVARELEEARYQFKVQYNDRAMTAETYVAETMDKLKASFKELAGKFGKPQVKLMLKQAFDQQVMDILAAMYWIDPKVDQLASKDSVNDTHWQHRLDASTSTLTKSGVGRKSTQIIVEALRNQIETLTQGDPFNHHPETRAKIQNAALEILSSRFHQTADQVENCVKPYKYQVDVERHEWDSSLLESERLLKTEIEMCERSLSGLKSLIGQRKLNSAMKYVKDREAKIRSRQAGGLDELSDPTDDLLRPTFNPQMLQKAQEAVLTQNRVSVLRSRLGVLRSKSCRNFRLDQDVPSDGSFDKTLHPTHHPQSIACPEVFLNAVEDKLAYTAVMFIHLELLSEFFYQFPREIENLMLYDSDKTEMVKFARQNPSVRKHLEMQDRKDKLELVMQKLEALAPNQIHNRPSTSSRLFSFFS